MKKFKIVVIAIVLLLSLIVILQNTESVKTKFLFKTFELPSIRYSIISWVLTSINQPIVCMFYLSSYILINCQKNYPCKKLVLMPDSAVVKPVLMLSLSLLFQKSKLTAVHLIYILSHRLSIRRLKNPIC